MASEAYFGQAGPTATGSDLNAISFLIRQELSKVRTNVPVKIIAVHGGGAAAAPTVDVQPLIKQTDGQGNSTDHGIIYGIPVSRSQGGGSTIINDPKVGDIGHMSISDRDTSALKANQGSTSTPGSQRMHDMSDGIYTGAILNPANPTQAVQFTDTGVKIFGAGGGIMEINGADVYITGTLHVTGDVIAGTVSLQHHVHSGVTPGGGDSGPPVP